MSDINFNVLPDNLPEPIDNGACNHLKGKSIPSVKLISTSGNVVDVSRIKGKIVLYFYPLTGKPGESLPVGWDQIPGARGCTPQACSFRDHFKELEQLNTQVFGISTQNTDYQSEVVERLHLPFSLLSDSNLKLANSLSLPLFEVESKLLNKRVTLIIQDGLIIKVFYPVFPPDKNAEEVIEWLSYN
ncbi:peroxiredoxin [Psychrobacillus sp. OK032]|uniref:peroxiredoxin n=1 Tax=Psychrobacillus sp. OK032 TaxID=1884358 RepID=UPI0008C3924A|nr:peroxiredoxin [Psychrobacillus sp. OK032]SES12703.1 Peroxiredoxin [Psychrobacillus sp. OK032]